MIAQLCADHVTYMINLALPAWTGRRITTGWFPWQQIAKSMRSNCSETRAKSDLSEQWFCGPWEISRCWDARLSCPIPASFLPIFVLRRACCCRVSNLLSHFWWILFEMYEWGHLDSSGSINDQHGHSGLYLSSYYSICSGNTAWRYWHRRRSHQLTRVKYSGREKRDFEKSDATMRFSNSETRIEVDSTMQITGSPLSGFDRLLSKDTREKMCILSCVLADIGHALKQTYRARK